MSLRSTIAGWLAPELRSESLKTSDPYIAEFLGLRDTAAGEIVSPDRAVGVPAVHACVQLLAESTASLPLMVFRRREDGGREVERRHPLYRVLHEQANARQTAMEFREQLMASVLLTGNGYARKILDGRGAITALEPLSPGHIQPELLKTGRVRYRHQPPGMEPETLIQDEVLHVRYRSADGFTGLSPVTIAREAISVALSQQQFEGKFYKNGARQSVLLSVPRSTGRDAQGSLKDSYERMRAEGIGASLVLPEGSDVRPLSLSQKDAEWVESRHLTLEDIARIFRIPPPAIGVLRDATYSNITEQQRSLVMHTLRPWLVRLEQAMNASLLTVRGRGQFYLEHKADALLRGNQKERFEAYRIARQWGWLSINEIRELENWNPIGSQGDSYDAPMNGSAPAREP